MKMKILPLISTIALCVLAGCSDDSSSPSNSTNGNNIEDSCTESPMTVEEMKTLLESFKFSTTTPGVETLDAKTPMYKVSHKEFNTAMCDTTYPAIMQAAGWTEEASGSVGSGNFVSFVGYRYIKKYGCTDIAVSFICRDGIETGTTNFYVEYLKNARKEHLFVGTYE